MVATTENMNGHATPEMNTLEVLEQQLTAGYKPQLPIAGMYNQSGMPQMFLTQDTERMLTHPVVRQAMSYYKGGIAGAEFWGGPHPDNPDDEQGLPICPTDPRVDQFVKSQCERFWDRGVPPTQGGYEYGWLGSEQIYDDDDGVLKWCGLFAFAPANTFLLTQDFKPVGVRVTGVQQSSRPVDLWMAGDDVPAKGLWYAHQPRYNSYYGQSQLIGAWRPWRRLAWVDGAETVIDGAFYRFGYQGPIGRYPEKDMQGSTPGVPSTTLDSQGNPRRFGRDIMRMMCEQYKAGGSIGLPSTTDEDGNYVWDITIPSGVLTGINGLIDYADYLAKQITQGIGVPPELLEASQTGSGYSGRRIPLESFLANQQQIADALLKMFVDQILRPLVRWNFGDVRFDVKVKSLIKSRTKEQQTQNPANPGQPNPQPGQPRPMPQVPPQQQPQPTPNNQPRTAMMSHEAVTDRVREIARKIVRAA